MKVLVAIDSDIVGDKRDVLRDIKASNPGTKIIILTHAPKPEYRSG